MTEAYDGRQVVGIDLHRRRSVIVRMTGDGRKLETARITNSAAALRREIAKAGKHPRVVVEATYGWYWAADVLEAAGAEVHLAHPLGVQATAAGGSRTISAMPRTWPACCGWAGCRRRGSRRRRSASCGS
jgi:transposase